MFRVLCPGKGTIFYKEIISNLIQGAFAFKKIDIHLHSVKEDPFPDKFVASAKKGDVKSGDDPRQIDREGRSE